MNTGLKLVDTRRRRMGQLWETCSHSKQAESISQPHVGAGTAVANEFQQEIVETKNEY